MTRSWWVIVLGSIGAGLLAVAVWPSHPRVPVASSPASPAPTTENSRSPTPVTLQPQAHPLMPQPAPTANPTPTSPAPSAALPNEEDTFVRPRGPLAEYKQRFENEPRDSAASDLEDRMRAAFLPGDAAPELFKSVLCRESICRLELRYHPSRLGAYVAAFTRMSPNFERALASEPNGEAGADQVRVIEVYLRRANRP
jgi:hypothetical protein